MNIKDHGFSIINNFFTETQTERILSELDKHNALQYETQQISDHNLLRTIPFINEIATSAPLLSIVRQAIGNNIIPVNALVLDKTLQSNWGLDWHQDLKIAVANKIETPGYNHWTVEYGVHHCIPPKEFLEKMLMIRIHLDDCTAGNGAVLVIPRSHERGRLSGDEIVAEVADNETICCEVAKGGIMCMPPLLLHKSPYSTSDQRRRILQITYSGMELSNGLAWV
jgi:ectoine hydroxylase-related dioxygenase (phytanoyl-CoA dioxygenase family)